MPPERLGEEPELINRLLEAMIDAGVQIEVR